MPGSASPSVAIVGAGSMGVLTGYHLSLAGAKITFLVRPHRQEQLSRPQKLFCYDDNQLKTFTGYEILTDPADLDHRSDDFVVAALDGAAMHAEAGQKVVDAIGRALRDTSTAVILPSGGVDLRDWFLDRSGLPAERVASGGLGVWAYEVAPSNLPLHQGISKELHDQADYGYRHLSPAGFIVDLSAPQVAHDFKELYDRNGVSQCAIVPVEVPKIAGTLYAGTVAWELLGWPRAADINPDNETWQLAATAVKEMRGLSAYGAAGSAASAQTTPASLLEDFVQMERDAYPVDAAAFNAYHHGDKMLRQKLAYFETALSMGDADGIEMPAVRELLDRLKHARATSISQLDD